MFLRWSFVLLLVQLASSAYIQTTRRPRISCPDNSWLLNTKRNSCLKALSGFILTWSDARSKCQQFGGDLVQIRDAETNKLVQSLLTKGQRYWTGVSDSNEDGTFEYLNGQNLTASFQPWAAREPNNKGGNERCVEIIGNARGAWNDKRCSKRRGLVCEVSPQSATPRPSSTTPRIQFTTPRRSTIPRPG